MTILNLKQAYCKLDKNQRFYQLERPIIGLTGGIATGKSSASKYLKSKGFPLIDADSLVKKIYAQDETIDFVKSCSESYINQDNNIDFKLLRKDVFNSASLKEKVENFIYARLPKAFNSELDKLEPNGAIIYDIPLLFEKNLASQFDITICIGTSLEIQLERVMQRDRISEDLARSIIDNQMSIIEKIKKADFHIDNSSNIKCLNQSIDQVIQEISE